MAQEDSVALWQFFDPGERGCRGVGKTRIKHPGEAPRSNMRSQRFRIHDFSGCMPLQDPLLASGVWVDLSIKMRAIFSMSPKHCPWTGFAQSSSASGSAQSNSAQTGCACRALPRLAGVGDSRRVRELLDIAWGSRPHGQRTYPFYADYSQQVDRKPWGVAPPCLTTSTALYSYKADAVVTGTGLLALQGMAVSDVPALTSLSDKDKTDLAGEAMFVPNVATILLAVFLNPESPWWS